MSYAKAITAINRAGLLLVFPLKNERDPPSVWYALHPRTPMRWEWSDDADDKVVKLWHLRTELSEGRDIVYAKWFKGRATMFSRPLFTALLKVLSPQEPKAEELSADAWRLFQLLADDSPQTSRTLRAGAELEGKAYEGAFNRAMKELWDRLLIVGVGEVDDGAFPSLAMGTTKNMFEDLWLASRALGESEAREIVARHMATDSNWGKYLGRILERAESSPRRGS